MGLSVINLTPLRRAYVDICKGYSTTSYQGKPLYIRHLSHREHLDYDELQLKFEEQAAQKGAKTEEKKMQELLSRGLWNKQKDKDIEVQRDYIIRLEDTKKTISQPSVLLGYEKQIGEERERLNNMFIEKAELLGMTCEVYAQRLLNDYYIVTNLFRDKQLTSLLFEYDSFDSFADSTVEEILKIYHSSIDNCSDSSLRKLAVQDFFTSSYGISGDNIHAFFGRPICEMTYYQIRLANIARYFRSIMEGTDMQRIDPAARCDPDAIERLYTAQKNASAMEAEGKVPANLSSQDIKDLNMEGKFTPITKELSGQELVKHLQSQRR